MCARLAAQGMPPGAPGNVTKATAAMGRLATGTLQVWMSLRRARVQAWTAAPAPDSAAGM